MENEIDKRKHTPRRIKFPLGFLALLLAVALCLIFREVVLFTRGSPMPCQGDIFYHLLILTHNPPLQFVLWLSVILSCIGLLVLALSRRVNKALVAIACFAAVGLLINTWMDSGTPISIVPIDTYAENDLLYRLIYVSGEGATIEPEPYLVQEFVLLQCDGLAWSQCDVVGAADMTVGGVEKLSEAEIARAHLYYVETHNMLVVKMDESIGWETARSFIGCMLF